MATSSAKKTAASASSKLTVMPLFLDQHGVVDEDGEIVTCYAEHCGNILLSDQPLPGSKKPRTLVSYQDFWKAGWETDEDGDSVDPEDVDKDEVEKFVIDPFTTTKQDLEEQFGKRYLFAIATWGEDAPEGKSGMMKGTGYSFFTGGDVLKKRGLVVEEAPKKKSAAAASSGSGAANDEEPETPEETIERLDEEATERDAKIEALEKKLNERVATPPAPAPSPMAQMKETVEVMNAFGHGPQAAGAAITQQREQWWQEQLANERQQSANALQQVTRAAATDLSTLRLELTGLATAASIRYEGLLKDLRDDNRAVVNSLNEQISARDKVHIQALADERAARVKEIERRDAAAAAVDVRMSELRNKKDDDFGRLTGDNNAQLLAASMATLHLNVANEKVSTLATRATAAETELVKVKGLLEEHRETIYEMKRALPAVRDAVGGLAEDAGFRIPPIVMKALIPVASAIVGLVVMYFMRKSSDMPPEVQEFIKNWKKATEGKMSPEDWADQQARDRQTKTRAAEEAAAEATRAQEEADTRQRSADYEEEQRQQKVRDDAERVAAAAAEERRKNEALRAERAKAVDDTANWKPPYGGNAEAVAASGTPATTSVPEVMSTAVAGQNNGGAGASNPA